MPFRTNEPRKRPSIEEQMHPRAPTLAEMRPPVRNERFEVVFLSRKVSLTDAMPTDFKRLAVTADGPWAARADKAVQDLLPEWTLCGVVKDHNLTSEEQMANTRAQRMQTPAANPANILRKR